MAFRPPIGESDFRVIRREGLTYVDKTGWVVDVLEDPARVLVFPRPRRFGKTLNLSTLRYFLERPAPGEDHAALFEDLQVWQSEAARAHFQRYPVIYLSFKDIKASSWEGCLAGVRHLLVQAAGLPEDGVTDPLLGHALRRRCEQLHQATGRPVVLLIDEYDTPLHAAWEHGYWDEAAVFFRTLLGAALKDNPSLYKGVLTGILRVARESLFSDLNNLAVYSILRRPYADAFGFTEAETAALVAQAGVPEQLPEVQAWYNGYRFGDQTIYNPWSVLCYLAHPEDGLRPYWVNTSGLALISRLLTTGDRRLSRDLETLLAGGTIDKTIEESLALRDVDQREDAVWTLLLYSGYLKPVALPVGDGPTRLALPNREVRSVYTSVFQRWVETGAGGSGGVTELLGDMLAGRARDFEGRLQDLVRRSLSFYDVDRRQPERVYHAFILGMLVSLAQDYEVRSNAESGYGRADVLVIPRQPGRAGVVLEFKRLDEDQTLDQALDEAMAQIVDRAYASTLRAAGADPVWGYGVAMDGKRLRVRQQGL